MSDTAPAQKAKSETFGKITEAEISRAQAQIGVPQPSHIVLHDPAPSANGISHFAFSYGDDTPLYNAPEYAKTPRWRGQIAPPTYMAITGVDETPPLDPEKKKL